MLSIVLVANAVWFGLGFHLFALRNKVFAKTLVAKEDRDTPVYDMLAETGKFLGGFNFAFLVLSILILLFLSWFPDDNQRTVLFIVFACAHGSQFLANVPIAIANRQGQGVWQVKGLMRFIFIIDCLLTLANLAVALIYLF